MSIAETARLIASLELKDKGFGQGVAKAEGQVNKLDKSTSRIGRSSSAVSKSLSSMGRSAGGLGGAFRNAGKAAGGLVGSLGPLLGIGGALGIGAVFATSIRKAEEFGVAVQKVAAITGESVGVTSAYVDALDKYGIDSDKAIKLTGILEKNLGKIAATTKSAAKFQADYGLNVLDSSGHVKSASQILVDASAFFKSNATATQKATALNKLYGKSWQDLIPRLNKGPAALRKELKEQLLDGEDLANLAKFKDAQIEFADAFGDLQVKIGAKILPALIGPLREFTNFLSSHSDDIVNFFKGAVVGARELGGAIKDFVIPAAKAIFDAFNAIPPDIRKLLIGGAIANKVLKVTFGFDPLKIIGGGIGAVLKDAFGGFFNRGSPGNPMFTKEIGVPGVGGPTGGVGGALGNLLKWTAALGLATLAVDLFANNLVPLANKIGQQEADLDKQTRAFGAVASQKAIQDALNFAKEQRANLAKDPIREALDLFGERSTLDRTIKDLTASLDDFGKRADFTGGFKGAEGRGAGFRPGDAVGNKLLGQSSKATVATLAKLDALHEAFQDGFVNLLAGIKNNKPQGIAEAAAQIAEQVAKGVGSVAGTRDVVAQLKAARAAIVASGDKDALRQIDAAIRKVEGKIQGREWIAAQKAAAEKIARSNQATGQKVSELKAIQTSLIAHGDTAAARIVGALLNGVVPAINNIRINAANPNLPPILPQGPNPRRRQNAPDIPIATPSNPRQKPGRGGVPDAFIKVTASHRDASGAQVIRNRYGPTPAEAGAT